MVLTRCCLDLPAFSGEMRTPGIHEAKQSQILLQLQDDLAKRGVMHGMLVGGN